MGFTTTAEAPVTLSGPRIKEEQGMQPVLDKLPRLFLASRSARRRELLLDAGIDHDAEHPGVEDSLLEPGRATPAEWVMALAYLKARAGRDVLRARGVTEARLVIGADTACVLDGALIGTPRDEREAEGMIRAFMGREHEVVTGVALIDTGSGRRELFADTARVSMGRIAEASLSEYLASGEYSGKAGGYNLRERVRAGWPISYTGDPATIMGLPMQSLRRKLSAWNRARVSRD